MYLKDEWTSVFDVKSYNKEFDLSLEEYLIIENKYSLAAQQILEGINIKSLFIRHLELNSIDLILANSPAELKESTEQMINLVRPKKWGVYSMCEICILIKLCLREALWCELVGIDDTYIHFGWDYYMYIGSARLISYPFHLSINGIYIEELSKARNVRRFNE